MVDKTSTGLIAYARAQLGNPYWMGTFGQTASAALYTSNKARLPKYYTASDFSGQYGKRVHDCIGLIKGYLWSDTPTDTPSYCVSPCTTDHSADSMYKACTEKGAIGTLPETPGALLFIKEGSTMGHVGVYVGNGQAIEAKGHAWGVVQTTVATRGWTHWGICPYITYESEDEEVTQAQFNSMYETMMIAKSAEAESKWSDTVGFWDKATASKIVDGTAPQAPITREQNIAILGRLGLIK